MLESNINIIDEKLKYEYDLLFKTQWQFLYDGWPNVIEVKHNRQNFKSIENIKYVKQVLYNKLGIVPVYFFLVVLWEPIDYCSPYRNIEKGLMMLYYLITNDSMHDLNGYVPKSSFYDIYYAFFKTKKDKLNKIIDYCFENLFSNINIRILTAFRNNTDLFKNVTLYLDGHDTRGIEIRSLDKSKFYSYKLKKAGFRTQVLIDINDMVLCVSESKPCKNFNDGTMFVNMNIEKKLHSMDCIILDGGYTQFVPQILDKPNNTLTKNNFLTPFRKDKNINLTESELKYNDIIGSFRSRVEGIFADLGNTFERFNNKKPIRTDNLETSNLQFKISFLLLNMKKMINLNNIKELDFHKNWLIDEFDFPRINKLEEDIVNGSDDIYTSLKIKDRIESNCEMIELQKQFIGIQINNVFNNSIKENEMIIDENVEYLEDYEIEYVVSHRGTGLNTEFLVKWKNYGDNENSWLKKDRFNNTKCIDDYFNSL
jgi:hypothetical protein